VAAVGGYGYQVGVSANEAWTRMLEADLQRLQEDNLSMRDELVQTVLSASSAKTALEDLRRRYAAEVPDGALAALLGEQLRAGVEAPVSKRFRPRTPLSTGPVSAVRFGDRITVTASAESAFDASGQREAWYDPAAPVQLVFRTLDGRELQIEGPLPLAHRMLVDGLEYRFSAIAGPTSFVEVTDQACAFP
jgi:hypothetical protein